MIRLMLSYVYAMSHWVGYNAATITLIIKATTMWICGDDGSGREDGHVDVAVTIHEAISAYTRGSAAE